MPGVDVEGLAALAARFESYPQAVVAALHTKADELAAGLADTVRDDKLSGGVLQALSGALRDSIVASVVVDRAQVTASVGSDGSVKYAAIQEYGGKTAAHEILPAKSSALAFVANGALHFARRVEHPGSDIPARSYLRAALDEKASDIVAALAAAAAEAWEGA